MMGCSPRLRMLVCLEDWKRVCTSCSVGHPGWLNEAGDGVCLGFVVLCLSCTYTQTGISKTFTSRAGNCSQAPFPHGIAWHDVTPAKLPSRLPCCMGLLCLALVTESFQRGRAGGRQSNPLLCAGRPLI